MKTLLPLNSLVRLRRSDVVSRPSTQLRSFSADEKASSVYEQALKFQRPASVIIRRQQDTRRNSVSLIGTVGQPIRQVISKSGDLKAHARLKVKSSPQSNRSHSFWVSLEMRCKMAEICSRHLKPNDCIYVSGRLLSFSIDDDNKEEHPTTSYKVIVNELNYVAQHSQGPTCLRPERFRPEGETSFDRYRNHLYLWQVFFATPHEWYDNRKDKRNPKGPDFKHKSTGEGLWLSPKDPPWIQKQLQLQDSKMAVKGLGGRGSSYSHLTPLVYDDIFSE